jgi:hypothetical protein
LIGIFFKYFFTVEIFKCLRKQKDKLTAAQAYFYNRFFIWTFKVFWAIISLFFGLLKYFEPKCSKKDEKKMLFFVPHNVFE